MTARPLNALNFHPLIKAALSRNAGCRAEHAGRTQQRSYPPAAHVSLHWELSGFKAGKKTTRLVLQSFYPSAVLKVGYWPYPGWCEDLLLNSFKIQDFILSKLPHDTRMKINIIALKRIRFLFSCRRDAVFISVLQHETCQTFTPLV